MAGRETRLVRVVFRVEREGIVLERGGEGEAREMGMARSCGETGEVERGGTKRVAGRGAFFFCIVPAAASRGPLRVEVLKVGAALSRYE